MIVAYESGIITFFSTNTAAPIYIFEAHKEAITQMVWDSKLKVMITGSKDKSIRFWKLPEKWALLTSKSTSDSQPLKEPAVKEQKLEKSDQNFKSVELKKKQNDSDSDNELAGWND